MKRFFWIYLIFTIIPVSILGIKIFSALDFSVNLSNRNESYLFYVVSWLVILSNVYLLAKNLRYHKSTLWYIISGLSISVFIIQIFLAYSFKGFGF